MRIALVVEAAGIPLTLASTAFAGSLAEGLDSVGAPTEIVGLALTQSMWLPEALAYGEVSAPWLGVMPPHARDTLSAAAAGVFDAPEGRNAWLGDAGSAWYLELLLERRLRDIGGGDPECVVLFYPRSYPLLRVVLRVTSRLGWRSVAFATEALSDAQIDPTTREAYIRCVAEGCDGVWSVSEHLADFWRSHGVEPDRIFVSPPPVRSWFFTNAGPPPEDHMAVYIGNLAHEEAESLLDIAATVRRVVPDFRLTIRGDSSETRRNEFSREAVARDLGDAVVVQPPVPLAEVPGVLASANVLLLPRAAGEFSAAGFPNKLGEYLASSRPVVATRVGEIPVYLTDGVSAMLVHPGDNGAFASAVTELLVEDELAAKIGAAGRAVASELSRAEAVAARTVAFIESLEPRQGGARRTGVGVAARRLAGSSRWLASRLVRKAGRALGASDASTTPPDAPSGTSDGAKP